jgi:hypothetical protein
MVQLAHESRADGDEKIEAPHFAGFVKAIPKAVDMSGRAYKWTDLSDRIDDEFEDEDWYDGGVHRGEINGLAVAYGGFAVPAPDLKVADDVDAMLTKPLVKLIRTALG